MAENFNGVTPINPPLKPDQQMLENAPPKIELSDISAMDAEYDRMMAEKHKEEEEETAAAKAAEEETDEEKEAERKAAEEAAAAEAAKTDEEKEAERKAAEEAEAAKKAEEGKDPYPDVQLPPNARGKSAEAFATVKQRFAADLSKRDDEIAALKAQVERHQAALTDPVPKETKEELEGLRLFRAKLDLQADPEFNKKYDGKIDELNEFIYLQLKSTGIVGDEHLAKIRELGGLDKVNYEQILEKVENPQVVRLVQSRLDEIAILRFEKTKALEVAQSDVEKYVRERQEAYQKGLTAHHEVTNTELEKIYSTKMPWLQDPQLPVNADANARTVHEDVVAFNKTIRDNMAVALQDDTPQMRAILIAGMGQLLWLKRQFEQQTKAMEISEKARKEAEAQLAKVKKASVSRLGESNAPPSGGLPKSKFDYHTSAGEALDALRKGQLQQS
jgi:hypothetical protein